MWCPPPPQGCKLGFCSQPPVGMPASLLCLANNCCMAGTLGALQQRFSKLYKRRWGQEWSWKNARQGRGGGADHGSVSHGLVCCCVVHAIWAACTCTNRHRSYDTFIWYTAVVGCMLIGAVLVLVAVCCRIFLHHYQEYMDVAAFDTAAELVAAVQQDYADADGAQAPPPPTPRARGLTFL